MSIYISPTEPSSLRAVGTVSSACEKKGSDILIITDKLRVGIQRKTWMDLIISLGDGRLAGSIPKMDMSARMVIIEGKELRFSPSGKVMVRSRSRRSIRARDGHSYVTLRHTRDSLEGVLLSLHYHHGLDVIKTKDLSDTIHTVQRIDRYLSKSTHKGVAGARKRDLRHLKDKWGVTDSSARWHAQKVNFLCAAGLGIKTAENLLRATGDRLPFTCTWSREELLQVPLIGAATVDRLLGMFE